MTCPSIKNKLKIQLKKLKENKDKLFEKEVIESKKISKEEHQERLEKLKKMGILK